MSATEAYQNNRLIDLKCWLIRHGLSQPKVARQLGITRQYLSDIFKDKRKAPLVRRRLIREIGIPAELVGLNDTEQKTKAA
jgi:transcriptional regulator with XRE-family HTH domain